MFTGLIECRGVIRRVQRGSDSMLLYIDAQSDSFHTKLGDSIAVNGTCLTIEKYEGDLFVLRAVRETVMRTSLSEIGSGSEVNLERALQLGGRLDGHIVQGHVDTVGELLSITPAGDSNLYKFSVPSEYSKFLAEKGSIAVDGISLTIASSTMDSFTVSLIPHTIKNTTLASMRQGRRVNVEFDIFARYIDRILRCSTPGESKGEQNLLNLLEGSLY